MTDLPNGMVPMQGRMMYRSADDGKMAFDISHGSFGLWKNAQMTDQGEVLQPGIRLSIVIATHAQEVDDYPIAPALTTEWLDIKESDLSSRGRAALQGYMLDYKEPRDDWDERPAALQIDSYGGTTNLRMELIYREEAGYVMHASVTDEFDRHCEIEAHMPLFTIGGSNFQDAPSAAINGWLTETFDPALLDVDWRRVGSETNKWQILDAKFKET